MSKTLTTFILDKSSSMLDIYTATIEAFNTYVDTVRETVKDSDNRIDFTLVQFSTQGIEKTWFETPIQDVPRLDQTNYKPLGGTPLIDAAYNTIQAIQASVDKKKADGEEVKVVVCIQTDGDENESKQHTWADLKELIASKQALGWQFNFMGAGIDAYRQSSLMGLSSSATVSYGTDSVSTRNAFRASALNTAMYASGLAENTSYSTAQKSAAGDAFDPTVPPGVVPAKTTAPTKKIKATASVSVDLGGGEKPTETHLDVSL